MSYAKTDLESKSENFVQMFLEAKGATVIPHPDQQFDAYDLRANFENGITYFIEVKGRDGIWPDLLIEILEDVDTGDLGWWYQTKANKIIYLFYENPTDEIPKTMYDLSINTARQYIKDNAKELFKQSNISTKGYGTTLSIFLPLNLATKIYPALIS